MDESNDTFKSIGNITIVIPTAVEGEKRVKNERNELLNELYELYLSQPEETRRENRKRYRFWMSKTYPEHCKKVDFSVEKYNSHKEEFKKAKKIPVDQQFIPYYDKKDFRWWGRFSHLTGQEGLSALRYMVSVARDKLHWGESVAKYILGCVKPTKE